MCGRFSLKAAPDDLEKVFGLLPPLGWRPRYNVAPTHSVLSIVAEDGARRASLLRWGLVPFWAKDPSVGNRMINARAETVAEKAAYRTPFARRRCLIPVDGFFEWQRRDDGKHPIRIHFADDRPFAIAGLWERWGRGATEIESCTLLTTAANPTMAPIHDRMPVILDDDGAERWLSPGSSREALLALAVPWCGEPLATYEVSTLVNSPAHDRPECLLPLEPPDEAPPPPLG